MIDNLHFALDGAWRVLAAGLVFGAGLPLVFALGIRSWSGGSGGSTAAAAGMPSLPRPVGRSVAVLCLMVVLAGVFLGVAIVAAGGLGREVSFEHGYPTIVVKED